MVKNLFKLSKGFTLVELMVSVSIFAFMTAFLVAKYGTFNQNILLTNLAYDVALTLRNAQSYGLNVKSAPTADQNYSSTYTGSYGVHFDTSANTMIFFADLNESKEYNADNNEKISTFTLQRGSTISKLCAGAGTCTSTSPYTLDIVFKRPDPNAIISGNGDSVGNTYAEITLLATDGNTKKVTVRSTGQISITN